MKVDEKLYGMFQEEMHGLENFRLTYAAAHSSIPLQEEEPDVKRLMEAMAFFTARSRRAAVDNVVATRQRIFRQNYPFLLSPLPAMTILQATPTARCAEPVFMPRNTEMSVRAANGKTAIFRTQQDLNVLPIRLRSCRQWVTDNGGTRIELSFESFYPRNDAIGELRLGINYLNNYFTSLRLIDAFETHLKQVSVSFEKKIDDETKGAPCRYNFGSPVNDDDFSHPIEKVRRFFHFPRNELFFNINIPEPPRNWQKFSILLDLSPRWPKKLNLHKEAFQLFTVPGINLTKATASPILCDGTQERYRLAHQEPEFEFEMHSINSVMRATEEGMVPLRAGILKGGNGSYEIETFQSAGNKNENWLLLDLPDAFINESTIVAEGNWYQSWFSEQITSKMQISPYRRTVFGVNWDICGNIVPHLDNNLSEDLDGFVQVLSLKNKAKYSLDDILFMLRMLGCVYKGAFDSVTKLLKDITVTEGTARRSNSLLPAFIYKLEFREYDPTMEPVIAVFRKKLAEFLKAWATESEIEVI